MTQLRLAVLFIAAAASAASVLNPDDPLPPVDSCDQTVVPVVDSLAITHVASDTSIQDYEVQDLIYGPQGGAMVEMRFAVEGAGLPGCMPMSLLYDKCLDVDCATTDPDARFETTVALRIYEEAGGSVTKGYFLEMFYPLGEGDLARVTIAAGPDDRRVETSVLMWLAFEGSLSGAEFDAGL